MTDLRPTNAGSCVVALDADVFIACFQLPAPSFAKLLPLPPQAGDGCVGYKDEGVVGTHTGCATFAEHTRQASGASEGGKTFFFSQKRKTWAQPACTSVILFPPSRMRTGGGGSG